jgi:hypothetical protein
MLLHLSLCTYPLLSLTYISAPIHIYVYIYSLHYAYPPPSLLHPLQGKVANLCVMKDRDRLNLLKEVAGTQAAIEKHPTH